VNLLVQIWHLAVDPLNAKSMPRLSPLNTGFKGQFEPEIKRDQGLKSFNLTVKLPIKGA